MSKKTPENPYTPVGASIGYHGFRRRRSLSPSLPVTLSRAGDALTEIDRFFKRTGSVIVALTVKEILDEHIAKKLA